MDDDLLFAISGLASAAAAAGPSSSKSTKKSSSKQLNFRSIEESARQLCQGAKENATWKRILLTDVKQRRSVITGAVAVLENQALAPRSCVLSALAVLRLYSTEKNSLFDETKQAPEDASLAVRIAVATTRCLRVIPSEIDSFADPLLDQRAFGMRIWDVTALVLRFFASHSIAPFTSSAIRDEFTRNEELVQLVVDYVKFQYQRSSDRASGLLQIVALDLVGQLSFSSKPLSAAFAHNLSAILVEATTKEPALREAALKAMINVSNHCPDAARALVDYQAIRHVMRVLRSLLASHSDLAGLDPKDFDGVLICLGLLGNLVEYAEVGASQAIISSGADDYLKFLCNIYASSLPVAARQSLASGSATETVEFGWTPEALIVSAHVCLVLGCVVRDSADAAQEVMRMIPGGKQRGFSPLIQVLKGFLDFQSDAGVLTGENEAIVRQVASYFSKANERSMLPPSSLLPITRPPPRMPTSATQGGIGGDAKKRRLPSSSSSSSE